MACVSLFAAWAGCNLNNNANGGPRARNLNNTVTNNRWNSASRISAIQTKPRLCTRFRAEKASGNRPDRGIQKDLAAKAAAEIHRSSTDEPEAIFRGGCADAGLHTRLVEYRKPLRCRKGFDLKQYCKRVNIRSIHFIKHCIYACLDGKWSRSDVHEMLACFCDWDVEDIEKCAKDIGKRKLLDPVVDAIALHIQKSIIARHIELPRARNKKIQDGITKKIRNITIASMMQQIYDYITKIGLQELFDAKFSPHQCATIPGRGQIYGKKFNERWIREKKLTYRGEKVVRNKPACKYAIEADVRKCYPSMSVGRLKAHLKRDVRNPELLWLVFFLIDKMTREQCNLRSGKLKSKKLHFKSSKGLRGSRVKRGISIGSYLSCNLCNYMLSYAWRYVMQDCCRWETRRGKRVRVRLVKRCIMYMDNITLYGDNKRDLSRAEQLLERYIRKELGMHIKSDWRKYRLAYTDRDGKMHGCAVDGMGYVVYPDHTEMRRKIFLRARRSFARVKKARLKKKQPTKKMCGSVVAYNGFFENTSSRRWRRRNDYKYHVFCTARRMMGKYMREENLHARQSAIEQYAAAG